MWSLVSLDISGRKVPAIVIVIYIFFSNKDNILSLFADQFEIFIYISVADFVSHKH